MPGLDVNLTCLDLFAGAGGLSEGLEEAGFHSLFASEIVDRYAETYKRNHPNAEVCIDDIRAVDPASVRKGLGLSIGELDLLAGGPHVRASRLTLPSDLAKTRETTSFGNTCVLWTSSSRVRY